MPAPPLITVDIGNSRIKFAAFRGESLRNPWPQPQAVFSMPPGDYKHLSSWLVPHFASDSPWRWRLTSVHDAHCRSLTQWLASHRPHDTIRTLRHTDLPVKIALPEPERIGMDRLMAAYAAVRRFHQTEPRLLLADIGTAVTVDLVTTADTGTFHGGAILPGLKIAAAALHEKTERLPLLETFGSRPPVFPGTNTHEAIHSGIFASLVGAISYYVHATEKQFKASTPLPIVLAGGAASFIREELLSMKMKVLPYEGFPDLLLIGAACLPGE